jgi:integral membrane protein
MTSTVATPNSTPVMPGAAKRFRVIAIAEAFSWLGLLIGMGFKYGPTDNPIGVEIFGPIHGAVFILYLLAALLCIRPLHWGFGTTVLALAAAVPPFFTLFFEMWALRTGRLGVPRPT